jgi:hypothetical protein
MLLIKYLNIEYSNDINKKPPHYEWANVYYYTFDPSGNKIDTYFNIKEFTSSFPYYMNIIQTIIKKEFPDVVYNSNYKVLYLRDDTNRRRLIGYNHQLDSYFDEIIYDFNNMSFETQVRLFMKCSHFVTIEGATLTNVIFMNKNAKVFDITPLQNSWQYMFGTYICISKLQLYDTGLSHFSMDSQYDEKMENEIKKFLLK